MALTAVKSAGVAGLISTVRPSASRAYTLACEATGSLIHSSSGTARVRRPPRAVGWPGREGLRSAHLPPRHPVLEVQVYIRARDRPGLRRVAEPVPDRDDAFDVPDLLDHVTAEARVLRLALDRDHAVRDRDREPGRVGEHGADDDFLDDVAADLRVGPRVHPEHVGAGNDSDQAAVIVHDGETLD